VSASDASAVIVRAHLPPALEALRRAWVKDANRGLPAHLTLLSPFVRAGELDAALRRTLAAILGRHLAFDYHLVGPKASKDTIYAGVDSERPFLELHRDLAAAFPNYPIYEGKGGELVPHVTVADGPSAIRDRRLVQDRAWHALPTRRRAHSVELIAPGPDRRWATVWRFRLPTID
jgi:2'-5' RNA ligase